MSLDTPFLPLSPVGRWLAVPLGWGLGPFEASAGLGPNCGLGTIVTLKTGLQHALYGKTCRGLWG